MFNFKSIMLPQDKANHHFYTNVLILVGILLMFIIEAFLKIKIDSVDKILLACMFATIIGVAKEIYDYISNTGTPDGYDLLADLSSVGYTLMIVFIIGYNGM